MDAILLSERISTLNSSPEIAKLTVKDPHKDLVADQLRVGLMTVMTRHQRLTILTSTGKENRYFADVELTLRAKSCGLLPPVLFAFCHREQQQGLLKAFNPAAL